MEGKFSEILKEFLEERNLSQVAFAKYIGVKQSQVSEWLKERLNRGMIYLGELLLLLRFQLIFSWE